MTEPTPNDKERIAAIPRSARVLGVDAEGRTHLFDIAHPLEIWVVDTDANDCVHYVESPDRSLTDWVLFVAERCGWGVRHHVERDAFEGLLADEPTPPTREEVLG